MNLHKEFGYRRRQIIPSARRSIHYRDRFANPGGSRDMRYGEDISSDEERDDGVDEVDNVMSKCLDTSTPIGQPRRHSMTPPNIQQYTDDSEHGVLAKSLPAKLPSRSRSYYSDDLEWRPHGSKQYKISDTVTVQRLGNWSADSRSSSSPSIFPNKTYRINQSGREEQRSLSSIFMYLLGLMAVLCAAYYYVPVNSLSQKVRYDEMRFRSDLDELGAKYKIGGDAILRLQAGISTIFERDDTSCVIFLYNSLRNDYDPSKFDGFVNNVVTNAAKFLRNETTPFAHRVVNAVDLNMCSPTQLVRAYKGDIAAAGVLLVKDVALVPSPLAMAFHYYCDEYQPLVRKSAIFFTLNTACCHDGGEKSSHASAEKCLKEKWSTVPKDNIGPLLTRVANIVVDVTSGL